MEKELSEAIERFNNIMAPRTLSAESTEELARKVTELAQEIKDSYGLNTTDDLQLDWLTNGLDEWIRNYGIRDIEGPHKVYFSPPEIKAGKDGDMYVDNIAFVLDDDDYDFVPASISPKTLEVFGITDGYDCDERYVYYDDDRHIFEDENPYSNLPDGEEHLFAYKNAETPKKQLEALKAFAAADDDTFMGYYDNFNEQQIKIIRKKDINTLDLSGKEYSACGIDYEIKKLQRKILKKTSR